jgi:hypothetical protein
VAGGQKPSLRWACTRGEEHLNDEAEFAYAVDVRRAREVQIRPLPSRSSQVDEQIVPIAKAETPIIEDVPHLPPLDPVVIPLRDDVTPETPEGRLAKWKSKLLDLTLRNKLLNFKPTKSTLRVICPDPGALEDRLADGNEFRVRAKPKMMSGSDGRDANVYAGRNGTAAMDDLVTDALGRNEIVTDIEEEGLEGRLLEIFRAASTGLEDPRIRGSRRCRHARSTQAPRRTCALDRAAFEHTLSRRLSISTVWRNAETRRWRFSHLTHPEP